MRYCWCLTYELMPYVLDSLPSLVEKSQCVRSGNRAGHLSCCADCDFQISVEENNHLINHVQEAGYEAFLFNLYILLIFSSRSV